MERFCLLEDQACLSKTVSRLFFFIWSEMIAGWRVLLVSNITYTFWHTYLTSVPHVCSTVAFIQLYTEYFLAGFLSSTSHIIYSFRVAFLYETSHTVYSLWVDFLYSASHTVYSFRGAFLSSTSHTVYSMNMFHRP